MIEDAKLAVAIVILIIFATLLGSKKYAQQASTWKAFVLFILSVVLFGTSVLLVDFSRGDPGGRGNYYDFGLFLGGASVYLMVHIALKLYNYWGYHVLFMALAAISIIFSVYDQTAGIVLTLAGGILLDYVARLFDWFLAPKSLLNASMAALKWTCSPWGSKR